MSNMSFLAEDVIQFVSGRMTTFSQGGGTEIKSTAVFKKVATSNIDFASRDGNRTHQNVFRSCDSNFVRKRIMISSELNFESSVRGIDEA